MSHGLIDNETIELDAIEEVRDPEQAPAPDEGVMDCKLLDDVIEQQAVLWRGLQQRLTQIVGDTIGTFTGAMEETLQRQVTLYAGWFEAVHRGSSAVSSTQDFSTPLAMERAARLQALAKAREAQADLRERVDGQARIIEALEQRIAAIDRGVAERIEEHWTEAQNRVYAQQSELRQQIELQAEALTSMQQRIEEIMRGTTQALMELVEADDMLQQRLKSHANWLGNLQGQLEE